ncbi:MAG TPA: hypothetical protein VF643_03165 [Sphingomonas sp.]|jgi:prolipoprotein diacylglyceryltransferase
MIVFIVLIAETCADSGTAEGFSFHGGVVGGAVKAALALRWARVSRVAVEAAKSAAALDPVRTLSAAKPFEIFAMLTS